MFVKAYRYRVQPDKTEEYLATQKCASQIYQNYVRCRAIYLGGEDDLGLWLELKAGLDPDDPEIHKEYCEQIRS